MRKRENKKNVENRLFLDQELLTIEKIFNQTILSEIVEKFANVAGVAVAIADYRGEEFTKNINYCDFCRYVRDGETPLCTVGNAVNAFGIAQASVVQKPFIYFCPYNLLMFAIPIIVNGQYLGGFIGGQVRCEDAPDSVVHLKSVLTYDKELQKKDAIKRQFENVKIMSYQKFVEITELISAIVYQLCDSISSGNEKERDYAMDAAYQNEKKKVELLENKIKELEQTNYSLPMIPHFVQSTMIAIANMAILENAMTTNEIITDFSKVMNEMYKTKKEIWKIRNEIKLMESYLNIQRYVIGDHFSFEISMDEHAKEQRIPNLIFFPFVENTIWRGSNHYQKDLKIEIKVRMEQDEIIISVKDNIRKKSRKTFVKTEQDSLDESNSIGSESLDTAKLRMKNYFGKDYNFSTESDGVNGTVHTLRYNSFFGRKD